MRTKIIVIAGEDTFHLVPLDSGLSTGHVILVKVGGDENLERIVELVLHETSHSWLINGLLYGDPVFQEGAAQLLAWLVLRSCINETIASRFIVQSEGEYRSYLLLHLALYNASLAACGRNVYLEALSELYRVALHKRGGLLVTFSQFLNKTARLASRYNCLARLELLYGHNLLEMREGAIDTRLALQSMPGILALITLILILVVILISIRL